MKDAELAETRVSDQAEKRALQDQFDEDADTQEQNRIQRERQAEWRTVASRDRAKRGVTGSREHRLNTAIGRDAERGRRAEVLKDFDALTADLHASNQEIEKLGAERLNPELAQTNATLREEIVGFNPVPGTKKVNGKVVVDYDSMALPATIDEQIESLRSAVANQQTFADVLTTHREGRTVSQKALASLTESAQQQLLAEAREQHEGLLAGVQSTVDQKLAAEAYQMKVEEVEQFVAEAKKESSLAHKQLSRTMAKLEGAVRTHTLDPSDKSELDQELAMVNVIGAGIRITEATEQVVVAADHAKLQTIRLAARPPEQAVETVVGQHINDLRQAEPRALDPKLFMADVAAKVRQELGEDTSMADVISMSETQLSKALLDGTIEMAGDQLVVNPKAKNLPPLDTIVKAALEMPAQNPVVRTNMEHTLPANGKIAGTVNQEGQLIPCGKKLRKVLE